MRILIVEDDERIAESLAEALTDQHYIVDIADSQAGWKFVETVAYELILLDDAAKARWQPLPAYAPRAMHANSTVDCPRYH